MPTAGERGRANRRADILLAALRVLGREGARGFSAATVAAEAGVSKANVFHHFPVLDTLVLDSFEMAFGPQELFPPTVGTSLAPWLEQLGEGLIAQLDQQRGLLGVYFAVANRAVSDPEWSARLDAHIGRVKQALVERLAQLAGAAPVERLAAIADAVIFGLDGLAFQALAVPDRRDDLGSGWTVLARGLAAALGDEQ